MNRRVLYIDCVGGVAGDMLLSALVEAGDCRDLIDTLPARLGFTDVRLEWSTGRPSGFAARHLTVHFDHERHPHHRGLADIEAIIAGANLPDRVQRDAMRVFRSLAEAEGRVHGASAETVHFHEVGAVDAIVDIVGICLALHEIETDEIVCSPLPMGHGTIECAHGTLPLPAPAVAAMLPGVPVYDVGVEGETVTPTGAAVVTTLADRFDRLPSMTIRALGLGCGSRQYPGLPNLVRAFVGTAGIATNPTPSSPTTVVECNVDDLDPRVLPTVLERLLEAGALDAYVTALVMKKGRPGHLITAIARRDDKDAVIGVLLRETTSLGCRSYEVEKFHLHRRMESVDTPWGEVPVKLALGDGRVLRAVPEFEPCAEIARRHGVPLREVLATAAAVFDADSTED